MSSNSGFVGSLRKLSNALDESKREPGEVKRTYTLEQLIETKLRSSNRKFAPERLGKSQTLQKRAEILFRTDPLVWAGVNRLTREIASGTLHVTGGDEKDRDLLKKYVKRIRLKEQLPSLVKDVLIYGYSIAIIEDKNLEILDPKEVDFIKDRNGDIVLDNQGKPKGFKWEPTLKDSQELNREDVLWLNLFELGEYCLGITPLESVYKSVWIRMNIEEALGEAVYRHAYPIVTVTIGDKDRPYTPEMKEQAKAALEGLDSASEVILPDYVSIDVIKPQADLKDLSRILQYFGGLTATGLENPESLMVSSAGDTMNKAENETLDFEKAVSAYQDKILIQLEEQLFSRLRNTMSSEPKVQFEPVSAQHKLLKSRRISMMTDRGVMKRDTQLENYVRGLEGIPPKEELTRSTECIFKLTDSCKVREEQELDLVDLSTYCNICPLREDSENKDEEEQELETLSDNTIAMRISQRLLNEGIYKDKSKSLKEAWNIVKGK